MKAAALTAYLVRHPHPATISVPRPQAVDPSVVHMSVEPLGFTR
jgi:hypothetical protein